MGALLFHPEFYKVAVSFAGCHDNRMDKIWWNEQWMGWPLGPQYDASSNVVNANKLQGKLLLLVGELDENVDPSSTLQVANALIKANKTFDFFMFPGGDPRRRSSRAARAIWRPQAVGLFRSPSCSAPSRRITTRSRCPRRSTAASRIFAQIFARVERGPVASARPPAILPTLPGQYCHRLALDPRSPDDLL
jgi:hypothetical protein